jgi:hypothetical protein
MFIFIGHKIDIFIISLILLKCFEHLHHISKVFIDSQNVQMDSNVGCGFNIFEMASCELVK